MSFAFIATDILNIITLALSVPISRQYRACCVDPSQAYRVLINSKYSRHSFRKLRPTAQITPRCFIMPWKHTVSSCRQPVQPPKVYEASADQVKSFYIFFLCPDKLCLAYTVIRSDQNDSLWAVGVLVMALPDIVGMLLPLNTRDNFSFIPLVYKITTQIRYCTRTRVTKQGKKHNK